MAAKKVSAKTPQKSPNLPELTELSWDEIRAMAKSHGVPAKGTRSKLEAAIENKLNKQAQESQSSKTAKKGQAKVASSKKKVSASKKSTTKKAPARTVTITLESDTVSRGANVRGLENAQSDFKIGQRVEVKSNGVRGEVVEVTELIAVALESGLTKAYTADQLKKLPPIL